jgi:SAM-dependent methyltransferase
MKESLEQIKSFYSSLLHQHGPDHPMALHWNSRHTQEIRFVMLSLIDDLEGRSVLDVGCGVGDLYGFLEQEKIKAKYAGWDISPEMIAAAKKKHPRGDFALNNIQFLEKPARFDYVLASGTMNVKISDHDRWVYEMIAVMFRTAGKGLGFNLLSNSSPEQDDTFYYADPERIFSYCRSLTPYVTLRHDYLPGDFTVYLYKSI